MEKDRTEDMNCYHSYTVFVSSCAYIVNPKFLTRLLLHLLINTPRVNTSAAVTYTDCS
jgi:hypothetical protein